MTTLNIFTLFALLSVTSAIRLARPIKSSEGPNPAPTLALATADNVKASLSNTTTSSQSNTTGTPIQRSDDKDDKLRRASMSQTPVQTLAPTTAAKFLVVLSNTTASSQGNTTGTPIQRSDDKDDKLRRASMSQTPVQTLAPTTAAKFLVVLSNTTASSQGNTTAKLRKTGTVDDHRRLIKMAVPSPAATTAAPAQVPSFNTTAPSRSNTTGGSDQLKHATSE